MVLASQQKGVGVAVGAGEGVGASVQAAAPAVLVVPAAQGAQVAMEVAPVALDQEPEGQGEALADSGGQKNPTGQSNGAPMAPQKKEAGQGRHSGGEGEGVGKLNAEAGYVGKGVTVDEVGGKYSQTYPDTNPDSYVSIKSLMQILPP